MRQSSIRRGAAQNMVECGFTDLEIMHFTGHTSVKTLHRYLGWGKLYRSPMLLALSPLPAHAL